MDLEETDPVTVDDDTFKDVQLIQKSLEFLIGHEKNVKRVFKNFQNATKKSKKIKKEFRRIMNLFDYSQDDAEDCTMSMEIKI